MNTASLPVHSGILRLGSRMKFHPGYMIRYFMIHKRIIIEISL